MRLLCDLVGLSSRFWCQIDDTFMRPFDMYDSEFLYAFSILFELMKAKLCYRFAMSKEHLHID
jgi:hypothetical protein